MSSLIQELVAENELLRRQLEELAAHRQTSTTPPADEFQQDTIELLKAEIEHLQSELAVSEIGRDHHWISPPLADAAPDGPEDCARLLSRLDELLGELDQSEQRIGILEELLRASEEATAAEHEERKQLEAWVEDIERRIGDRESDWKAEVQLLRQRLSEATERPQITQQFASRDTRSDDDELAQQLEGWRSRAAELQQQLADGDRERLSLNQKLREVEQQLSGSRQVTELEQELREERVRLAQERAELARQRADVMTLRAQADHQTNAAEQPGREVENRMRAFRQHLREIHEQERNEPQQQQQRVGLSARIAQLWKRLDG